MKFFSFFSFFIIIFSSHAYAAHDFSLYPAPIKAPAAIFETSKGAYKTLGHFQGKVIILNFWATWCKPCIVEMPSLNRLQQKYKNDVKVIALISPKDNVSKVRSFLRRYKLRELGYYIDNTDFTAQSYNVTGIPTSFVFNKQGKLVSFADGSIDWMSKDNIEYLEKIITE